MSRETDLAWCAGFFDGEGHISYSRSYPHMTTEKVSAQLQCSVPQASENIEVLEFFESVVELGKIKGPYKMPNGKDQHRLIFGIKEIGLLFELLEPYLRHKKAQDFRRALLLYEAHSNKATTEDWNRKLARAQKKLTKNQK